MTCDAWTPHREHQHVRRYRKGGIKEPEKHAGRLAIAPSRRRSTQSVFGCATFMVAEPPKRGSSIRHG